ncbi:MAG: STAS domain-containing protein [Pseudomonadota bacterium]
MYVNTQNHGDVTVFQVVPHRFDASLAHDVVAEALESAQDDCDTFLIDMEQVTMIDSIGIGALIRLMKSLGRERRLELCALAPRVHNVFRLTRLDGVFTIHPTLNDGLQAHYAQNAQIR